jgi:hypothetical protein
VLSVLSVRFLYSSASGTLQYAWKITRSEVFAEVGGPLWFLDQVGNVRPFMTLQTVHQIYFILFAKL